MNKSEGLGKMLKRELMRAMLERTQSMDTSKMMKAFGAKDPVTYDDVGETLNIAYVNRAEVALAMDVFRPKVPEGTELPVIILVHGGGLFMGDRGLDRPYCRLLAHKGYLVFSLEYRLAPKATIGEQLDDVCAGMDKVGNMLVDYDVDFSRIFLVADSAGAYLAAYVSAMHESVKLQNTIGYKPSRMVYSAVGFLCGMFYTNKALADQIFGDKRDDEKFKRYMDPEHPEILHNLPPVFMVTSCGDSLNNNSLKFNRALKKAGRPSKLVFFGDEELRHIFMITDPEHPKSIEATDRMLAYFEEQAAARQEKLKKDPEEEAQRKETEARIADGSINDRKVWASLKERLSGDRELLKRTAVIDCTREYTYEQMFDEWERYARAFSGLGICAENGSRAALCAAVTAEPLFAFFGLNMTGAEVSLFSYTDFMPGGMWKEMLEKEHITDLIVSDIMVTPENWEKIQSVKEQLGLRNVILMHSMMGGPSVGPAELTYNELNCHMLRRKPGAVFMDDLLEKYDGGEIRYDESKGERTAFIMHTPGAAHGMRNAKPYTDAGFNRTIGVMPAGYSSMTGEANKGRQLRTIQLSDLSSMMSLSRVVCGTLAHGDTLVTTFFGSMHPKFIRAIDYYDISLLYATESMADSWLERRDIDDIDFSYLRIVEMPGGLVPPEKKEKYEGFFRAHNCACAITDITLPEETENDTACDSFSLFDFEMTGSDEGLSVIDLFFKPWKFFIPEETDKEEKKALMPEIPEDIKNALLKYGNRLSGMMTGRKQIDHDFED